MTLALSAPTPRAAQVDLTIAIDVDRDMATGCDIANAGGLFLGAELLVVTEADNDVEPPSVQRVYSRACVDESTDSFGPQQPVDPGVWPVGLNLGPGGEDVVETGFPVALVGAADSVQAAFWSDSSLGGSDLLGTNLGTTVAVSPAAIPVFSLPAAAGALALMAAMGFVALRRRRPGALYLVLLVTAGGIGVAWAAALDGQIDDWTGIAPLLSGDGGDIANAEADLASVYSQRDGTRMLFRFDVEELERYGPAVAADSYALLEDGSHSEAAPGVLGNDVGTGGTLSAVLESGPAHAASFGLNADGSFSYTPEADYYGSDGFVYLARDDGGDSGPVSVTLAVAPVNDPPGFSAVDPPAVGEDAGAQSLAGWASFSPGAANEAGQSATYHVSDVTNPGLFSAGPAVSADGTLSYTPAANAHGSSDFSVTVQDDGGTADGGQDTSAAQHFTLTVTSGNDVPQANAQSSSGNEDTALPLTLTGSDVDGDNLAFSIITGPSHGSLGGLSNLTATSADVTYTPDPDYTGSDSFTFQVDDSNGGTDTAVVSLTIDPLNDGPVANAQSVGTNEETPLALSLSGADVDNDPLTFSIVTGPSGGSLGALTQNPPNGAQVTYTPGADFFGNDSFTFQVDDGNGGQDTAVISVAVANTPDTPVAHAQSPNTDEDSPLVLTLTGSDADVESLSFSILSGPSHGSLGGLGNLTTTSADVTYTPDANYYGADSFTFQVQDPGGLTASATVSLTVNAVNDPPTAGADAYDFIGNTGLHVDRAAGASPTLVVTTAGGAGLLENDSDPVEGSALAITALVGSADTTEPFTGSSANGGTVALYADGSFTYTPAPGDPNASDSFQYQVSDGGDVTTATATLTRATEHVWFVKNDAGGGGLGRSSDPFDTLAEAEAAAGPGDIIFIHLGDGGSTGQDAGITLGTGQRLWGEGHGLALDATLNGVAGPHSLVAAGTRPVLAHGAGHAVRVDASAAGRTGVEVRGLTLSATGGNAISAVTAGANDLELTVSGVLVNAADSGGVDLDVDGSGTVDVVFEGNSFTAASITGNAFDLTTAAAHSGSATVALRNNTGVGGTASAVVVNNTGSGTLTVTDLSDNSIAGSGVGAGIVMDGVTFDADPADADFDAVSLGSTAIGAMGDAVTGAGVALGGTLPVSGRLQATDLDVYAGGSAVGITGSGAYAAGSPDTGLHLVVAGGNLSAGGGAGLALQDLSLGAGGLDRLDVTASSGAGLALDGVTGLGAFVISAGQLQGAAGSTVAVTGGSPQLTYGGDLVNTAGRLVAVSGTTGGAVIIQSGTYSDSGSGTGILIDSNAGSVTIDAASGTLTGSDGIDIQGGTAAVTGAVTLADLSVVPTAGIALDVDGSVNAIDANVILNNVDLAVDGLPAVTIDSLAAGRSLTADAASSVTADGAGSGIAVSALGAGAAVNFNGPVDLGQTTPLSGGTAVSAAASGGASLSFADLDVTTSAQRAWDVYDLGTFTVTTGSVTQSGAANGILVQNVTTVNATLTGLSLDNDGGYDALHLAGIDGGTVTVTGSTDIGALGAVGRGIVAQLGNPTLDFQGAVSVSNRNGRGIDLANVDNPVTFAGVTIGSPAGGTGEGIHLLSSSADVTFGATSVSDSGGKGIRVDSAGGLVSFAAGSSITTSADTAFAVSGGSGAVTFNGGISHGAGVGSGIDVSTSAATVILNGTLTVAAGKAVSIDGLQSGGSVTFNDAVTATGGSGVTVQNSAGDVTFAAILDMDDIPLTSVPLALSTNTGVYRFADVRIQTNGAAGFTASSAGTVGVAAGIVNASGGPALSWSNTAVHATDGLNLSQANAGSTGTSPGLAFDQVSGGAVSLGSVTVNGTSGTAHGISIAGSAADFTVTSADVDGSAGDGLYLSGANGTVSVGSLAVDGAGGAGIYVSGNSNPVTVSGGAIGASDDPVGNAVTLSGGTADVTLAASLTKASAGRVVQVSGRTAGSVSLSGAVSCSTGCTGISVSGNSGGSLAFSNASKVLQTGANTAVNLANNTGTNIDFTGGGLAITTTGGTGFAASGGGTITVTGSGNTVSSGAGTAVNLSAVTTGGAGFSLERVDANGAANAIVLNNVSGGGFTVTGDGSQTGGIYDRDGSGGTLQNTTAVSVLLTDADGVTLRQMNIVTPATDAIKSDGGGNITLSAVLIDSPTHDGWDADELTGSNHVNHNSRVTGIDNAGVSGIRVDNSSGTMSFTIDASTFDASTGGQSMVLFKGHGTAQMDITVHDSNTGDGVPMLFSGLNQTALSISAGNDAGSTSVVNATVSDAQFINSVVDGFNNLEIGALASGTTNFTVSNNLFQNLDPPSAAAGVLGIGALDAGVLDGTVSGNTFNNITGRRAIHAATQSSASGTELIISGNSFSSILDKRVMYVSFRETSSGGNLRIANNTIGSSGSRHTALEAIYLDMQNTASAAAEVTGNIIYTDSASNFDSTVDFEVWDAADLDLTFSGNTVDAVDTGFNGAMRFVTDLPTGAGPSLCLDITGNNAPGAAATDYYLENDPSGSFLVAGVATADAAGVAAAQNSGSASVSGALATTAACATPVFD